MGCRAGVRGFLVWAISAWLFSCHVAMAQDWRDFKVHPGDDLTYALPAFDDGSWPTYLQWRGTEEGRLYKGNLWLRGRVTFEAHPPGRNDAFAIVALASCEVYLDGHLIGANGEVGADRHHEVPGHSMFLVPIPPHLDTPGEHTLAIRFANHHGSYHFRILAIAHSRLNGLVAELRAILLPLTLSSAFFIVAIYFMLIYAFSFREKAFGLFALLTLLVGALYILEQWRLVGYVYSFHPVRLLLITCLSAGVSLLLPWFFMVRHQLAGKALFLLLPCLATLGYSLDRSYDGAAFGFFLAGLILAQGFTARALWLRRSFARGDFIGCLITTGTLVWSGLNFLEDLFFYCFLLLMLLVFISLSLQIRSARHRLQAATLTSARLETELLRKHLQPHFMLNTLTAAMEWIERDPPAAVRFIGALAGEMRALFDATGRRLITLAEEIAMCRAHLETQAFRTGLQHRLTVSAENDRVLVPPAIFLTLLENGLTHGKVNGSYHFRLWADEQGHCFRFEVDQQDVQEAGATGTGIRYVKARLQESFPDRWHYRGEAKADRWCTIITIDDGVGEIGP